MLAIKSETCFFLVENFPSYFVHARPQGLTNPRNGTGRNGQIPGPIPRNGPSKFKGHKSQGYFGIPLRFAGAASRMVEETLCNRADDGCKGIIT